MQYHGNKKVGGDYGLKNNFLNWKRKMLYLIC